MSDTPIPPKFPLPAVDEQAAAFGRSVASVIDAVTRSISWSELAARGPRNYRIASRTKLIDQIVNTMAILIDALESQTARFIARERDAARYQIEKAAGDDRMNAKEEGAERVLRSVVDMVDVVEALVEALDTPQTKTMAKALDRRLDNLLKTYAFERIPTSGIPFDSERHECVDVSVDESVENGYVLREVSRGYARGTKVLRFAKVVVNRWK
jgi:molecular chaperone GrpE (heat shock protein)